MAKTQEELAVIKSDLQIKHKPLFTIEIPAGEDGEETRTIFLKKFDRQVLSAVQKLASGNDPIRAVEAFIKNTYVGGDVITEILGDFDMLRSLEGVIIEMITAKKATLKKN